MKRLFIASIVLFEAGSALCGAAPTMNALIVGRVIAGVGGSGVYIGYEQTSYMPLAEWWLTVTEYSTTFRSVRPMKNGVGMFLELVSSGESELS